MSPRRYLCSQLVVLRNNSGESGEGRTINLEEIWENGAVLEAEEPIDQGAKVEIHCGDALFAGRIARVVRHEFGWRLEMEFSPLTPWSLDKFRPEHLLDPSALS